MARVRVVRISQALKDARFVQVDPRSQSMSEGQKKWLEMYEGNFEKFQRILREMERDRSKSIAEQRAASAKGKLVGGKASSAREKELQDESSLQTESLIEELLVEMGVVRD